MAVKVVLIGGAPGAGKTTLGRDLGARLGFDSMTVDDLVMAIRGITTPATQPPFHVMPDGHVRYFTDGPVEKLIADAKALEAAIWPALDRLIRARRRADRGIVLDWWLFPPAEVAALMSADVRSLWLHIDPDELDRRERASTGFGEGAEDPERMHANFMARSLWRNQLIADQAVRLRLPVLHQDGTVSRDTMVDLAVAAVGSTLS